MPITVSLPKPILFVRCWPPGDRTREAGFYAQDVLTHPKVDKWVFVDAADNVVAVFPKDWIFVVEPDMRAGQQECKGLVCRLSDLVKEVLG